MPRLLLGVSGGIAAYKALELVRLATGEGHAVRVIQTRTAQRFVGAASFAALSGAPVLSSEFERDPLRGSFPGDPLPTHDPASHLALSAAADVLLIAPASANTIAKLAHGLADNLLTSAALGASCPVIVAPAMNDRMWEHAATQANLALLRERGIEVLTPGTGRLATHGEWGPGRLPEPAELLAAVNAVLGTGRWSGTRTLVTAGGTREPIDAVRFLGNRSSGRMGFAIADAARARGSEVVVVAANVSLPRGAGVRYVDVATAAELAAACEREFDAADVLVMCAAVADFRPVAAAPPTGGAVPVTQVSFPAMTAVVDIEVNSGGAAGQAPVQVVVTLGQPAQTIIQNDYVLSPAGATVIPLMPPGGGFAPGNYTVTISYKGDLVGSTAFAVH